MGTEAGQRQPSSGEDVRWVWLKHYPVGLDQNILFFFRNETLHWKIEANMKQSVKYYEKQKQIKFFLQ